MPILDASTTYGTKETCNILRIEYRVLLRLVKLRAVRYCYVGEEVRFPRDYVDGLAPKLHVLFAEGGRKEVDTAFVQLYSLGYDYKHPPLGFGKERRAKYRSELNEQIESLVAQGLVVHVSDLISVIEGNFKPRTVHTWVRQGVLAAVRTGSLCCMSRRHFNYQVWLHKHCLSADDAAYKLGLSVPAVCKLAQDGALKAVKVLDRFWRFDPRSVRLMAQKHRGRTVPPAGYVLLSAAAQELAMTREELRYYVRTRSVHSIARDGVYFLRRADVQNLKHRLSTLEGDFAWLDEQIRSADKPPVLYCTKQVCRMLGLCDTSVGRWRRDNLLPSYAHSPCSARAKSRYFVRLYIDGLARFMNGEPSMQKAREYKQLCAQARIII